MLEFVLGMVALGVLIPIAACVSLEVYEFILDAKSLSFETDE